VKSAKRRSGTLDIPKVSVKIVLRTPGIPKKILRYTVNKAAVHAAFLANIFGLLAVVKTPFFVKNLDLSVQKIASSQSFAVLNDSPLSRSIVVHLDSYTVFSIHVVQN
jgi:hypothetical protein